MLQNDVSLRVWSAGVGFEGCRTIIGFGKGASAACGDDLDSEGVDSEGGCRWRGMIDMGKSVSESESALGSVGVGKILSAVDAGGVGGHSRTLSVHDSS